MNSPTEDTGYYVYAYIDPRTQEPFYIGKGISSRDTQHLRECWYKRSRTRPFYKYLRSLLDNGIQPIICRILEGLTNVESYFFEQFFIDAIGRQNSKQHPGPLLNKFRGGTGGISHAHNTKLPHRRFKGIRPVNRQWVVTIKLQGKTQGYGSYPDEETAARAYDEIIMRERGSGYLNFPEEWKDGECQRTTVLQRHRTKRNRTPAWACASYWHVNHHWRHCHICCIQKLNEERVKREQKRNKLRKKQEAKKSKQRRRSQHGRHQPYKGKYPYRGIFHHPDYNLWGARIRIEGIQVSLKYHKTPEDAARAYDEALITFHNGDGRLNLPEEWNGITCLRPLLLTINPHTRQVNWKGKVPKDKCRPRKQVNNIPTNMIWNSSIAQFGDY